MQMRIAPGEKEASFIEELEMLSGQNVMACYQCGKCSASCPFVDSMDLLPSQVLKYAQLGKKEALLRSKTIWVCASCFKCSTICPKDIDVAKVMEALRLMVLRKDESQININALTIEELAELPQIALVSCMRKFTS